MTGLRTRPTVADIRALKGQRCLSMLYVDSVEEARAADAAGIDLLSIAEANWTPQMRQAAGGCFVQLGLQYGDHVTSEDYLRAALRGIGIGADSVYCAASLETVRRLTAEHIPVVGHVGLIPPLVTWTGGFKAVGKTAQSAMGIWQAVRALEDAGAFGAEIEVVPARVSAEICKRTSLMMMGMGAGSGADAQYLFAEDVLGYTRGHQPRHAKVYRDFAAEYARLQTERTAAFKEFRTDVESGAYPGTEHDVAIGDAEFAAFIAQIERHG